MAADMKLESAEAFAERMDYEVCSGVVSITTHLRERDLALVRAVLDWCDEHEWRFGAGVVPDPSRVLEEIGGG